MDGWMDGRMDGPMSAVLLSKPKDGNNRTIILPVVLYVCNIWSLILWEVFRLKLFEKRLLRKIFGSKGDEMTGDCVMCPSTNIVQE